MERNVMSWGVAIVNGYEPRLYTYDVNQIPLGEFDAVLDFKIWSKRILAVNCYFTKIDTRAQFIVTVYCNNRTGHYEVPGSVVDFALCLTSAPYRITVVKNIKEKITVTKAEVTTLSKVAG